MLTCLLALACSQPGRDRSATDPARPLSAGLFPLDAREGVHASSADAGQSYIQNCGSLFAARIVEKQIEAVPTFPEDCNWPLATNVALLRAGTPACLAGESANACRNRLYNTPPALSTDLPPGCWTGSGPTGCLRGTWLPKCANGTNTGCSEPEVVCQDGTRPMIYAEAATTGSSNIWLFYLGGEGGPCNGDRCWFNYRYNEQAFAKAMSSTHPDFTTAASLQGAGVTSGGQNPFAGYNRVRFERCTDAASDATETVQVGNGVPPALAGEAPGAPIMTRSSPVPVWHKGLDTWLATFRLLATPAGHDLDGDGRPDLPSLSSATKVLLAGSSDASVWLVHAADYLRQELRLIAGATVDVRILLDGNFEPSLDNEGRYHPSAPTGFNMFSHPYHTTLLCQLPDNGDGMANEACSDSSYLPGPGPTGAPTFRDSLDARAVFRDASCEAAHGVGAAQCSNKLHTLLHHVNTPFLVLADQEDYTVSHALVQYADDYSYFWDLPGTYRTRVLDEALDVKAHWSTAAREEGAGVAGNTMLILPKSRRNSEPWGKANHVHFGSDTKMAWTMTRCTAAGVALATVSFSRMIGAWVSNNAPEYFIMENAATWDGVSSYWVTGSTCRPPE